MMDPLKALFEAASFATRSHRHQLRKDGVTPYAAHPFRVCLVVRHVFGIDDPRVLTAALLHDVIEDTTIDFDDVAERFGGEIAGWVAALTKDMRLPESEREEMYVRVLRSAPWPVAVCKLADIYDNLNDSRILNPDQRARTLQRAHQYLAALESTKIGVRETEEAVAIVKQKLEEARSS
jgi:guanosine-3',5'-bis(diphosphate) 3'-pyrophosphohydrolase